MADTSKMTKEGTYITSEGVFQVVMKPYGPEVTRISSIGTVQEFQPIYTTMPAEQVASTPELAKVASSIESQAKIQNVELPPLEIVETKEGLSLSTMKPTSEGFKTEKEILAMPSPPKIMQEEANKRYLMEQTGTTESDYKRITEDAVKVKSNIEVNQPKIETAPTKTKQIYMPTMGIGITGARVIQYTEPTKSEKTTVSNYQISKLSGMPSSPISISKPTSMPFSTRTDITKGLNIQIPMTEEQVSYDIKGAIETGITLAKLGGGFVPRLPTEITSESEFTMPIQLPTMGEIKLGTSLLSTTPEKATYTEFYGTNIDLQSGFIEERRKSLESQGFDVSELKSDRGVYYVTATKEAPTGYQFERILESDKITTTGTVGTHTPFYITGTTPKSKLYTMGFNPTEISAIETASEGAPFKILGAVGPEKVYGIKTIYEVAETSIRAFAKDITMGKFGVGRSEFEKLSGQWKEERMMQAASALRDPWAFGGGQIVTAGMTTAMLVAPMFSGASSAISSKLPSWLVGTGQKVASVAPAGSSLLYKVPMSILGISYGAESMIRGAKGVMEGKIGASFDIGLGAYWTGMAVANLASEVVAFKEARMKASYAQKVGMASPESYAKKPEPFQLLMKGSRYEGSESGVEVDIGKIVTGKKQTGIATSTVYVTDETEGISFGVSQIITENKGAYDQAIGLFKAKGVGGMGKTTIQSAGYFEGRPITFESPTFVAEKGLIIGIGDTSKPIEKFIFEPKRMTMFEAAQEVHPTLTKYYAPIEEYGLAISGEYPRIVVSSTIPSSMADIVTKHESIHILRPENALPESSWLSPEWSKSYSKYLQESINQGYVQGKIFSEARTRTLTDMLPDIVETSYKPGITTMKEYPSGIMKLGSIGLVERKQIGEDIFDISIGNIATQNNRFGTYSSITKVYENQPNILAGFGGQVSKTMVKYSPSVSPSVTAQLAMDVTNKPSILSSLKTTQLGIPSSSLSVPTGGITNQVSYEIQPSSISIHPAMEEAIKSKETFKPYTQSVSIERTSVFQSPKSERLETIGTMQMPSYRTEVSPRFDVGMDNMQDVINRQIQETPQKQETMTRVTPRLAQVPRTIITTTVRTPVPPMLPPAFIQMPSITSKAYKPTSRGYEVEIFRKGKWLDVSKSPLPRTKAIELGEKIVDKESLAARFRIKEVNSLVEAPENYMFQPSERFRSYAIKKGRKVPLKNEWIEESKYRLEPKWKSREVGEIQQFIHISNTPFGTVGKAEKPTQRRYAMPMSNFMRYPTRPIEISETKVPIQKPRTGNPITNFLMAKDRETAKYKRINRGVDGFLKNIMGRKRR